MKKILLVASFVVFCFTSGYSTSGVDSLESALKTAKGESKVKIYNELFRAYLNTDPVKAIGFAREGLMLGTEVKDLKGMAASYNNLGVAYRNQGAFDKALENYFQSLKLYDSLNYVDGIATTKNNIGTIFSVKKDYTKAMKYFEESFQLFSDAKNNEKMIGSLNNLGNLHSDLQLYEQALQFYSQAMDLSQKSGKIYSDALNNMGNLYFRQGNYQKSVEYYLRSLTLAKNENNKLSEINVRTNLGEAYSNLGQYTKAMTTLDSALAQCRQLEAFAYEPQILKSRAENYYGQGKMKEAYESMLSYDKAREKIYGEESTRKIAQMEVAIELQAKEKELEAFRKDAKINSLEL
ncbi:MAG TPA: hypothetical protein DGG95_13320, partial [Cytophagales bacterium]|nr:hypothetical protein [Cytophagales bacterium]